MTSMLKGIRVLDLTNVLAGPFCCYQLAQLGADVIKVEHPEGGDLARQLGADAELNKAFMGASFLAQNAGKKSVTVNLKSKEGKELFLRLVATADVVVENFRPSVMSRLGLGPDDLRNRHPGLIYCAISGFGATGPLASNPAYDQIIQGLSGVMSVTGEPDGTPLRVGFPVCDTVGGLSAAFAITAALVRKAKTNEGETIDVSMLEATMGAMGWTVSNWLIAGVEPAQMGNQNSTAAPSGTFRTGSGLLNIAANKQTQFEDLCVLAGVPELASDERFSRRESRKLNRVALTEKLEAALSKKTAAAWAELFNERGIPAGQVLTVPEILEHPQIAARDMIRTFSDVPGVTAPVSVVRAGFRLGSSDPGPQVPPPVLGQDNATVLAELGYGPDDIARMSDIGAI